MRAPCKIEGCERESRGRGWCATHWRRWRLYGDPMYKKVCGVDWNVKGVCSVEDCGKPNHARGLCSKHLSRFRKHGDPSVVAETTGRPLKGDQPSYGAIHRRLSRSLGSARLRECADCGKRASSWSYQGGCANELRGVVAGRELAYSEDASRYAPRCTSCHRKFDRAGDRTRDSAGRFVRIYHPTAEEAAA